MIQAAATDLGIPCVPSRYAILTRAIRPPACAAPGLFLRHALRPGLRHRRRVPDARPRCCPWRWARASCASSPMPWCRASLTDAGGRAKGVEYFDKSDGTTHFVKARVVVLAASACESAQAAAQFATAKSPQGLANSSGQVGRSLMDTTGTNITGHIPVLEGRPRYNEDGDGDGASLHPVLALQGAGGRQARFPARLSL